MILNMKCIKSYRGFRYQWEKSHVCSTNIYEKVGNKIFMFCQSFDQNKFITEHVETQHRKNLTIKTETTGLSHEGNNWS